MEFVTLLTDRLVRPAGRRIGWPLCTLAYVFYDAWNYARHSGMFAQIWSQARRDGTILAACHVLEKGLTFPEPKRAYGQDLAQFVCTSMMNPRRKPSESVAAIARGVMVEYQKHHKLLDYNLGPLAHSIHTVISSGAAVAGGTQPLWRDDFCSTGKGFDELIRIRRSVREFSGPPSEDQIERAVSVASRSPSSCNRQGWHVYWTRDPERCARVADLHSGSRGFGNRVPAWIAITVDIAGFQGPKERWAAYVDGGMFAMTLLLSLTEAGVASCALNWSTEPSRDRRLHDVLDIPSSEIVIMLVAAGTPPDSCDVPVSARRPLSEILRMR